ncbi:MAG: DUF2934 domain-containing protein [Myxococcaceae bacterium]|nr:DUF2934 domain-containing protein [Myxococcaceae bacterium]
MSNQTQPNTPERKTTPRQRREENAATPSQPEPAEPQGPTHEQIARRAYELWLQHGQQHGRAEEDWFQAERDLKLGRY